MGKAGGGRRRATPPRRSGAPSRRKLAPPRRKLPLPRRKLSLPRRKLSLPRRKLAPPRRKLALPRRKLPLPRSTRAASWSSRLAGRVSACADCDSRPPLRTGAVRGLRRAPVRIDVSGMSWAPFPGSSESGGSVRGAAPAPPETRPPITGTESGCKNGVKPLGENDLKNEAEEGGRRGRWIGKGEAERGMERDSARRGVPLRPAPGDPGRYRATTRTTRKRSVPSSSPPTNRKRASPSAVKASGRGKPSRLP